MVKDFMVEMVKQEMTDNPDNLDYQDPKEKLEPPEFLARKEMSESVKLEEMVNLDCQDEMVKREMTDNPDNLD